MAQYLARLAVEAFERFELAVVTRRIVGNARRLHEVAALIEERAFVVLLLRSLMNTVQQFRRAVPGGRVVGLRVGARRGGQYHGCTEQKCRQPSPNSRFFQPQTLHQTSGPAWSEKPRGATASNPIRRAEGRTVDALPDIGRGSHHG